MIMRLYAIPLILALATGCARDKGPPRPENYKSPIAEIHFQSVYGYGIMKDVDNDGQVDVIDGSDVCFYAPGFESGCRGALRWRYPMSEGSRKLLTDLKRTIEDADFNLAVDYKKGKASRK